MQPRKNAQIRGMIGTVAAWAAGWIRAMSREADGAKRWRVSRTEAPATKASILTASVVRDLPSAVASRRSWMERRLALTR
jgi:hypothetical protein